MRVLLAHPSALIYSQNYMTLHLNKANLYGAMKKVLTCLARGQTNFARSILSFRSLPNPRRRYADHFLKVPYTLQPPSEAPASRADQHSGGLYVHTA